MRAIHKYNSKDKEGARRIAQSMGYRFSIWDMPESWFQLMARAGITFDNEVVDPNTNKAVNKNDYTDKETLTL